VSHPAVGIDLGTTFCALAAINPAGKPEIVANKEGERITASAVYFQKDGPILVGQLAADAALGDPERVARWVKREMGNAEWQFQVDGRAFSPVDISAMILKKIRQDAESVLGPIKHAVVTVPAYFDEVRRKATMDAAEEAGLEVLRIINEPTAAALAYASGGQTTGTLLVYDFGGGTFDVSIVKIASPEDITVVASEGDHQLGGFDLDKALAAHFDEVFHAEFAVRLMDGKDKTAEHRTLAEAEKAKRKLSSMVTASPIPLNWGSHWMNASVERSAFEDQIRDYLIRTEMLIEDALSQAGLKTANIDGVILVGGSTRVPAVKEMLRRKFKQEPLRHVNPDEAVALGAALQAGMIMQERGLIQLPETAAAALNKIQLQDVTNHSFGTTSVGEAYGREQLRNSIIIRKNTQIPCSKTESFYTIVPNQQEVNCEITQGEDEDPEFVNTIAEGSLELPAGRPAGCEIRVTYSYDANGRMSCEFLDVESGETKRFDLDIAASSRKSRAVPDLQEVSFDDLVIE